MGKTEGEKLNTESKAKPAKGKNNLVVRMLFFEYNVHIYQYIYRDRVELGWVYFSSAFYQDK